MKCDLCLREKHDLSHHEPVSLLDMAYKLTATLERLERRLAWVKTEIADAHILERYPGEKAFETGALEKERVKIESLICRMRRELYTLV